MIRLLTAFVMAILVTGCSTTKSDLSDIVLLKTPPDLSTVFLSPDGKLYIVPEKGVVIETIKNPDGAPIEWAASGAYVVVDGFELNGMPYISVKIEGRYRTIVLAADSGPKE